MDPGALAHPSPIPDVSSDAAPASPLRLDYDGRGLASVLYFLAETASPLVDAVSAAVAEVISGFEGFEFNTVGTDKIGFSARFQDSRSVVPAANLSSGTLSLIGLLLLLMNPDRSPILCLEEPENGLTPRATRAVYEGLVAASSARPPEQPSQILVSSHSPFVVCEAWNGDGLDFVYQVKPEAGEARIRPITEIIDEHQIQLRMRGGERATLGLETANQVMDGYYS